MYTYTITRNYKRYYFLIITRDFAEMRSRFSVLIEHAAIDGFAVNYPMVVRIHSRDDFAFDVAHGIGQDWTTALCWFPIHAFEAICAWRETFEKMFHWRFKTVLA